ncbi:transporter [Ganoderma sinense ZZ0214-1]|uniref:RNA helicase n=1 Tax=Ganoderma sinense ZZ0214-1 TaxID=1077348 RepID=A0A2G8S5E5_9APHY|nr:transporter [Ganoderma sinense ZZ0214-1]
MVCPLLSLEEEMSEAQNVFVNKGNDRSNVSIVVRPFEHPLNTYADLDFLLPKTLRSPSDIPLTYLYVDHKVTGGEIIDHLISQLLEHPMNAARSDNIHNRPVPSGVIRPFNANMSQAYRNNAMAQFRAGNVRILVCTDAAGMGCNIPNIKRVVQWKLPGSFSQFIQRAGRAARGPGQTGVAILLVEKSAYNIDIVSAPAPSIDSKKTKKPDGSGPPRAGRADAKQVREYAIAHGLARGGSKKDDVMPSGPQPHLNVDSADEGLLTAVQSVICRRKIWAEVFRSTLVTEDLTVPCCDICDPTLLDATRPQPLPPERKPKNRKRGLPDLDAQAKLRSWRRDILKRSYAYAQYDGSAILDDDLITSLTTIGPLTPDIVSELLKEKWIFWEQHGTELTTFLQTFTIVFTPLPPKPRAAKAGTISVIDLLLDTTPKRPRADSTPDASTTKRARLPEGSEQRPEGLAIPGPSRPLTTASAPVVPPNPYLNTPLRHPPPLMNTMHIHCHPTQQMPSPAAMRHPQLESSGSPVSGPPGPHAYPPAVSHPSHSPASPFHPAAPLYPRSHLPHGYETNPMGPFQGMVRRFKGKLTAPPPTAHRCLQARFLPDRLLNGPRTHTALRLLCVHPCVFTPHPFPLLHLSAIIDIPRRQPSSR